MSSGSPLSLLGLQSDASLSLRDDLPDFWTTGRELGVDYTTLYEVPSGGFQSSARRRRRRRQRVDTVDGQELISGESEDDEEGGTGGSLSRGVSSGRRRWNMWRNLNLNLGGAAPGSSVGSASGYQPIQQDNLGDAPADHEGAARMA